MSGKYLLALTCFLAFSCVNGLQTVNGKIKITIGTTSGCGDTVRLIRDQLADVYQKYKDFLEVEFVPWGRTVRHDNGTVTCQFGEADCWANRLHRCALNMLKGNPDAQMHYMTCEFTTPFPSFLQRSYQCTSGVNLNIVNIDQCVENPGDSIDYDAEAIGTVHTLAINFIPTVVFNDQIDLALHQEAQTRLESMICFALADDPSTGITSCRI